MSTLKEWSILIGMVVVALTIGLLIGNFIPMETNQDGHKYKLINLGTWVHDPDCYCGGK